MLKSTEQDSVWHAEGDVHTHTQMVMDAVVDLIQNEAAHLSESDQQILFWAAVLHDIGKPKTTKVVEEDRVYVKAPQHEIVGAGILLHTKPLDNLSGSQWLQIIKLVAYHQKPKHLVLDDAKQYKYIELLRDIGNFELMYLLEKADIIGRHCQDKEAQLELIELFWLECQDLGVKTYDEYLEQSKTTLIKAAGNLTISESDIHRAITGVCEGDIFMLEESLSKQYMFESRPEIELTVGCSGSGKSTYIQKQLKDNSVVISYDDIREKLFGNRQHQGDFDIVKRESESQLKQALRENKHILWDATSTRIDFRSKVIATARAYGAFVKIVVFVKSKEQLLKDNNDREFAIPSDALLDQISNYQLPTNKESHKIDWIIIT